MVVEAKDSRVEVNVREQTMVMHVGVEIMKNLLLCREVVNVVGDGGWPWEI